MELTQERLVKVSNDMFEKKHMLTDEQITKIANKINEHINVPFLKEEKEFVAFFKIIKLIDQKLYNLLPNEYYEFIHDASDGISRNEAIRIAERITPIINKLIDIPIISEEQEKFLISFVLKIIINATIKDKKL